MSQEIQVPAERIEQSILPVRDQKVMLDEDLAMLFGVTTAPQSAGQAQSRSLPQRLHVPARGRGVGGFEVTICDFNHDVANRDVKAWAWFSTASSPWHH
jgi:hypothetical protein